MEDVTFQKPDRHDGMPGRMALVSHDVSLRLPRAVLVGEVGQDNKRAMLFKTDVAACTQLSELDQRIIDITKKHVKRWFDNKLSVATLSAMYVPAVTASNRVRVCVRQEDHYDPGQFAGAADIVLSLTGICFEPHSFYPMWSIARAAPSAIFLEEDDDVDTATPLPTPADARRIKDTIREKLSAEAERLRSRLDRVQTSMDRLQTAADDDIGLLLAVDDDSRA